MFAESVRKPLKMFQSSTGVLPAAISTIIVSPTARPRPIMTAEKSPLMAVGITIRVAVCQRRRAAAERRRPQVVRDARERVLGDRVDDRDDREAHHEADDQRVALDVGAEQGAARVEAGSVEQRRDAPRRAATVSAAPASELARGRATRRPCRATSRPRPRAGAGSRRARTAGSRRATARAAGGAASSRRPRRRSWPSSQHLEVAVRRTGARTPGRARGDEQAGRTARHAIASSRSATPEARSRPAAGAAARGSAPTRNVTGTTTNDEQDGREPRARRTGAITSAARKPSTTLGRLAIISIAGLTARRDSRVQELAGVERREQRDRHPEEHRVERRLERAEDQREEAELRLEVVAAADGLPDVRGPEEPSYHTGRMIERAETFECAGSKSNAARRPGSSATTPSFFGAIWTQQRPEPPARRVSAMILSVVICATRTRPSASPVTKRRVRVDGAHDGDGAAECGGNSWAIRITIAVGVRRVRRLRPEPAVDAVRPSRRRCSVSGRS